MKITNISELDEAVCLLNRRYLTEKFNFYNDKLDKILIEIKSFLTLYFSLLLLIYSDFFMSFFELQIILTAISLIILFFIISWCEYNYKFYQNKKNVLYYNIKFNNYNKIYEELFFENKFNLINLEEFFPYVTLIIFSIINLIFYSYLCFFICNSSLILFFNIILKNFLYYYYTIISFSIIFYLILIFIFSRIVVDNNFRRIFLFFIFPISIVMIVGYAIFYFYQSAWYLRINLENGHILLYREISHDIDKKFDRSIATIKIILDEKNTENYTQDDFVKTVMHAAKEYKEKYNCDITRVYIMCYNIEESNNKFFACATYIPDKKGLNGKKNSPVWLNLLSVEKGYSLAELEYLKNYDINRSKDNKLLSTNTIEKQYKTFFSPSFLNNEPRVVIVENFD